MALFSLAFALLPQLGWSQLSLPQCPQDFRQRWHSCNGRMTFPNGNSYEGEYQNDTFNGWGTYIAKGVSSYTGEWREGKRHGIGALILTNGHKYVGEFRTDEKHGEGIEYAADGTVLKSGEWENDTHVKAIAIDSNRFPFAYSHRVIAKKPADGKMQERDRTAEALKNKRQDLMVSVITPSLPNTEAVVTVENNTPVTLVFKIDIYDGVNRTDLQGSSVFTLPPMSSIRKNVQPVEGKQFSSTVFFSYGHGAGNLEAVTQREGYKVPFEDGIVTSICQYPHGATPAIDFCVPIGTPVIAAKDGIVIGVVNHHGEGGPEAKFFDKANFVELLHADGTRALYSHLLMDSVSVARHAHVKQGEVIGKVGISGQTSGPHLHFHVTRMGADFSDTFIDPIFVSDSGERIEIKNGLRLSRSGVQPSVALTQRQQAVQNSMTQEASADGLVNKEAAPQKTQQQPKARYPRAGSEDCDKVHPDPVSKGNECLIKGNPQKTLDVLIPYTAKIKFNGRAFALMGIAHSRLEQYEQCATRMRQAMDAGWGTWDTFAHLGKCLDKLGRVDESIKWHQNALKLLPTLVDIAQRLSEQLIEKGKKKEALLVLESFDKEQQRRGGRPVFEGRIIAIRESL